MIYLNHKDFEKVSGPITRALGSIAENIIGPVEKTILKDRISSKTKSKAHEKLERKKYAKLQPRPKVETSGLRRAKQTIVDDSESHSLRRAIERSKSPEKVTTEVRKSTEPIYAGGNTAANMRGVIRAEEKQFRDRAKKRFGKHSRVSKSALY